MTTQHPDNGPQMGPGPRLHVVPGGEADAPSQPLLRGLWTADRLMATQFPAPKWAVPGILAEGVTLIAGPPKVGKSWLSLGLGLTVAAGGKALGSIPTTAGPVLYLALEDTARRLQNRMGVLLGGRPAPAGLHLTTECPPLPQGGAHAIAEWLTHHPDARMVVIDVFAKVRGQAAPGASAYDADYAAVGHVKRIADHFGVALVLIHHVRKAGSDDFLAEVSGTNGLAGAADTTIVLKRSRGKADGVLHITGRDVDEAEHAMSFRPQTGAWEILPGPASDHTAPDTRSTILRYLRSNPGQGPKAIADATGADYDLIRRTCARMVKDGALNALARGVFSVPAPPPDQLSLS
ncbi:AAA family ATPase [Streptacidiphilus monticola]|uniref:AAA family ATPase n=1 Tax=Streptacidiphilus monticola TaxID=2161674 RepID=A0ABW1GC88_9ACTN